MLMMLEVASAVIKLHTTGLQDRSGVREGGVVCVGAQGLLQSWMQ